MISPKEKGAPLDCDDLVIGAGLSGLLTAISLKNSGRKVKVVETKDSSAAAVLLFKTASGDLPSTLRFVADDPAQVAAVKRLEEIPQTVDSRRAPTVSPVDR